MIDSTKQFFVLAFVPPEIRAGKTGAVPLTSLLVRGLTIGVSDVAADAVPPRWPPQPQAASDGFTYELAIVPVTSISLITSTTIKVRPFDMPCDREADPGLPFQVDAEGIAERHRRSFMENALADYVNLSNSGLKLQEADWAKVRGLEFREAMGERDQLVGKLAFIEVDVEDEAFAESVSGRVSHPNTLDLRW